MSAQLKRTEAHPTGPPTDLPGITARAVVWAVLLTVATYLGITRLGFIRINWVPYVVPPVPPLMFLLILQGLNVVAQRLGLTARLPRFLHPLTRGELLLIYAALCVALAMDRGGYIIHYLLVAPYYGGGVTNWAPLFEHYPEYFVPHDPAVVSGFFEGAPNARVPWQAWKAPLLWWGAFQLIVVFACLCLVAVFRRQWTDGERLKYPLLFLPLEMTGGVGADSVARGFFRNPYMWLGFGAAAAFNGLNIAHAFCPSVPGLQWHIPIDTGMVEPPWRYLRPLGISFALELWGLAYLVSGEVLLSGWLFYFGMKLVKLLGYSFGYQGAGLPFYQEVSAGGYIAMLLFVLWAARTHLRNVARSVWLGPQRGDENEPLSYRALVLGLVVSTGAMIWMLGYAGHKPLLLILYFACLYMYVLLAGRIRAEVGPPVLWTHPYGFDQRTPVHLLGTRAIVGYAGEQATTLFYALFWIGRTVYAHSAAQYFVDGFRLADYGPVRRRSMTGIMLLICVVGLALAFWYHLDVGYKYGQGLIGAKVGRAGTGWAMNWSRGQYGLLRAALDHPTGPPIDRLFGYAGGFAFVSLLAALRTRLCNFPFHPIGFLLATLYGDHTPYWWPFLFAWLAQRLALRYGGLPLYRRLVPAFLGLTLGHCLIGGVLWRIVINYFIDPTVSYRYYLNLGG